MTSTHPTTTRVAHWRRPLGLLLSLVVLLLLGRIAPAGAWLENGATHLRHAGVFAAVLPFVLAYTVGALLFVPSAMFTFVAGFSFGAWRGALIGIPGIGISSFAVFLLSRTLLRAQVESWLAKDPRYVALDRLLAKLGARTVVLLRLSPLSPFSVLNYAFGLTGISKSHYLLATCIGTIPGSVFYAQLGAIAPDLHRIVEGRVPEGGRFQSVLLAVGLVLTALVGLWLGRHAKRAMSKAQLPDNGASSASQVSH